MKEANSNSSILDLIGVGIGPFNLGLASMLTKVEQITSLFFDQNDRFEWHPGLLMNGTTLQVPFFADLVTMADPTSPYSYLNYLKTQNRLYHFYFLEQFHIPRVEYNHYCQWVSKQLPHCRFGQRVNQITWHQEGSQDYFSVQVEDVKNGSITIYKAKNIVIGVGSTPQLGPSFQSLDSDQFFHSASFLYHRNRCREAKSITVIGSGQSAAEVFYSLLQEQDQYNYRLDWFTRSEGFFPMEYSKLGLEHFSADYIDYFHSLPQEKRDNRLQKQDLLYKGISAGTISDIYNLLYERTSCNNEVPVCLLSQVEIQQIKKISHDEEKHFRLSCFHQEENKNFTHESELIICATGYKREIPKCITELKTLIRTDEKKRFVVQRDYRLALQIETECSIFVQNNELHSHGVGSPDLGLGSYRNATIINSISGKTIYPVSHKTVFQQFGIPLETKVKESHS
ncbi:lysine N(6)-hydroxylase/L-ornithine N(5)-oxygenase family protein [Shimazuella kribbensis]|uniref:lysine N(6)-hydroxylase/L-ornithine N(5)-oxygenase family protein n=1 Tax=Shimazuella kribbensis TaxID=139808 RepID=UPI0006889278